MLEKYSYVFIIGAGASYPYKFPLGIELYENIRENYYRHIDAYFKMSNTVDINNEIYSSRKFCEELRNTSGISIDKYLNINKKFNNHGIQSIIIEILLSERNSIIPHKNKIKSGDWYTYLFQKMVEGLNDSSEIMHINKNRISFITFNYDRSLEHYLFENIYGLIKNTGKSRKDLYDIFKDIPIIHVYGKIGYLPWEKGFYDIKEGFKRAHSVLSYGYNNIPEVYVSTQLKNMIELMYDERKEKPEIEAAKKLILSADRILFLGFGYDGINLKILDLPDLLINKQVFGTAYKSTNNEIIHIKNLLGFKGLTKRRSDICDFDCLMLLREHLV
ncbi:MAG: hypothetical protein KAX28_06250 [Candidatus Marinimicrobia bacterium]|nr:hypothetical protein [Candidatus Neomarinimicrobiota bacterium]